MDLPTIVESLKTIDNKSFYKTADICQVRLNKRNGQKVDYNIVVFMFLLLCYVSLDSDM